MGSGEQAAVLKRQAEKAMKREFAKHTKRGGVVPNRIGKGITNDAL